MCRIAHGVHLLADPEVVEVRRQDHVFIPERRVGAFQFRHEIRGIEGLL